MSITVKDGSGADVVLDPATQTTLAAILAKLIAAPATEAKQDTTNTLLTTQAGYLDGIEGNQSTGNASLATIAALSKAEDAAHSSGDPGVMLLAVRKDTAAALAGTDGDYIPLIVDASGRLWVASQGTVAAGATDSGNPVKTGGLYSATLPTLTDGQRGNTQLDKNGRTIVRGARSATPTQSSVGGSASSASLLAANADRIGATVYNDSTAVLYLKLGTTASTSSYTTQVAPNGYYEVPFNYTGAIDGIWASATGNARITELT